MAAKQAEEPENEEKTREQEANLQAALVAEVEAAAASSDDEAFGHKKGRRNQHRPKQGGHVELWNAMVTKTLHPSDPKSRCAKAVKAVEEELGALRERSVWDEENPLEFAVASAQFPEAHFARLFSIIGVKK